MMLQQRPLAAGCMMFYTAQHGCEDALQHTLVWQKR
jgi:hypothetical protein